MIFAEIEHDDLYASTYGMMSESIHGSWNESMDWGLVRNDDGTFSAFTDYHPADVRFMAPALNFTIRPFRMWLERIDVYDDHIKGTMDWIERVNTRLFRTFDNLYAGEYDLKRAEPSFSPLWAFTTRKPSFRLPPSHLPRLSRPATFGSPHGPSVRLNCDGAHRPC